MAPMNRGATARAPDVVRRAALILATVALLVSHAGAAPQALASGPVWGGTPPEAPMAPAPLPPEALAKIDPELLDELLSLEGAATPRLHPPAGARVPDGPVTYLVYLEDEAPLAGLHLPRDRTARRQAVVARLRERAERSQRRAIGLLRQRLASGLVVRYRSYWIANVLVVEGGLEAAVALALLPEVVAIEPNRTIQLALPEVEAVSQATPAIAWGVDRIDADRVWAEWGITGQGIVVANMDSGVDWTHPDLQPKYRGYNASDPAASDHNYNWFDFTGTYPDTPGPQSGSGTLTAHGTHVMGTMVGSSPDGARVVGVAPGAQWIAVKLFRDNGHPAPQEAFLAGFQWLLAPTDLSGANPDPSKAPDVVCSSWGESDGSNTFYMSSVAMLRAAGIITVFSAGNHGPDPATIDSPASYSNTLAIGATDVQDNVPEYSSRGPSPWGLTKPDVTAPGHSIYSTVPGGGYATFWGGTSFAAPHAAGTVALMLQADRQVLGLPTLTITTTERILRETALDLGDPGPDNTYGYGRVNAYAAVQAVRGLDRLILPMIFRQASMAAP